MNVPTLAILDTLIAILRNQHRMEALIMSQQDDINTLAADFAAADVRADAALALIVSKIDALEALVAAGGTPTPLDLSALFAARDAAVADAAAEEVVAAPPEAPAGV